MDPIGGVGNFIVGLVRAHRLNEWAKLCFAMAWSYGTAFSFSAGTALVAQQPVTVALGAGLMGAAAAVCFLFARSPLTKNLMVALPRELILESEQGTVVVANRKNK